MATPTRRTTIGRTTVKRTSKVSATKRKPASKRSPASRTPAREKQRGERATRSKPVLRAKKAVAPVARKPPVAARMPKAGDTAPGFSLPDANGTLHSLADYRGRSVVLYFYPKDDTPGCTIEAHGFRDDHDLYLAKNATVIGVSKDTCESHRSFVQKHGLNFILLSDVTGETVERYGCWVEKSMYGKRYMGIARATFVIDPAGKVARVFPKVTPEGHSAEVLRSL